MASDLLLVLGVVKADVSLGIRPGNMADTRIPEALPVICPITEKQRIHPLAVG